MKSINTSKSKQHRLCATCAPQSLALPRRRSTGFQRLMPGTVPKWGLRGRFKTLVVKYNIICRTFMLEPQQKCIFMYIYIYILYIIISPSISGISENSSTINLNLFFCISVNSQKHRVFPHSFFVWDLHSKHRSICLLEECRPIRRKGVRDTKAGARGRYWPCPG